MANLKQIQAAGWLKDVNDNFTSLETVSIGYRATKFTFDFDEKDAAESPANNKAVGAHPQAAIVPKGAIVLGGYVDVIAAVTSGGNATIALKLAADDDLLTATAKTNLTLGALIPMAAAATTPFKLAADTPVTVTVGTAALTAGVLDGYIIWIQGEV